MPDTSSDTVNAAEAIVERRSKFSIIWVVPMVAILIGAWLIYKAQSEKGPTVTISFVGAEGVVEGKTKVKFKDVEVGEVSSVQLADGLKSVTITAILDKEFESYLTESTQFWVARPRLTGTHLTGLDTILSGPYVAISPSEEGKPKSEFVGLENPPVIGADTPGKRLVLEADKLGSLGVGSPVYFRQLKAGEVESYELSPNGKALDIKVFIHHPYDKLVGARTRFWNASGITASMSADGIKVSTESLAAIIAGGVAFDSPGDPDTQEPIEDGRHYRLYSSREAATGPTYHRKEQMLLYFDGSVRGLSVGAPVEVRGIKIGEVVDFNIIGDIESLEFLMPVLIEYEPERIGVIKGIRAVGLEERLTQFNEMVAKGFRGQLKTGNLLTGQLFVDLDFFPETKPAEARIEDGVLVIPTIPGSLQELRADLTSIFKRLQAIPFEEIGNNLKETLAGTSRITNSPELTESLASLQQTLAHTEQITESLNSDAMPELRATLTEARRTLTLLQKNVLREDSPIYHDLARALQELSAAARSIRVMADYLERHPDALIKGKRGTR